MARHNNTERIGVNAVERVILRDFGWIFREQPIDDMGIDAQIERKDDGNPSGKLIAVQIKTGKSHFKEKDEFFTYYGDLTHLDYWTNHSLPVLLISHFPDTNETYWVFVNEETATRTKKRWKIDIPKENVFSKQCEKQISSVFEGTPAQQKFRKLTMDEPLMRHISNGGKIAVELEEWINKSLSRSPVKIYIIDEDGEEELVRELFFFYTNRTIGEFAQEIFPWASISIDVEFYDEHQEDDEYCQWKADMSFINREPLLIYPYENSSGEVDFYRLELKLGDLAEGFLRVSEFLSNE